jgi:hypothetical protein
MNRFFAGMALTALLVFPAGAVGKPNESEKRAALAECKAERGTTKAERKAFRGRYHGLGNCVKRRAVEEDAENEAARENAAHECKAERDANEAAFKTTYGTNKNGKNAFGKCVSSKASQKKAELDAVDAAQAAERRSAANECAAERRQNVDEFRSTYGTNHNKRNAFGKCVTSKSSGA